jgi:hypothetical protein
MKDYLESHGTFDKVDSNLKEKGYYLFPKFLQETCDGWRTALPLKSEILKNPIIIDGMTFRKDHHQQFQQIADVRFGPEFKGAITSIISGLYGDKRQRLWTKFDYSVQVYRDGDYISPHLDGNYHKDGVGARFAGVFIFLNDKGGKGGDLVLKPRNTEEEIVIESSWGDMILMDMFYDNCISHEVTKVKNWDRFVLIGFCDDSTPVKTNLGILIPDTTMTAQEWRDNHS